MNNSVCVRDVDGLEDFGNHLMKIKEETEYLSADLQNSLRELGDNWQDGKYDEFSDAVSDYLAAGDKQLIAMNSYIDYIHLRVAQLREML